MTETAKVWDPDDREHISYETRHVQNIVWVHQGIYPSMTETMRFGSRVPKRTNLRHVGDILQGYANTHTRE